MAVIKQISQYDNNRWTGPYDIGAEAENISLNSIEGLTSTNVQDAIAELKNDFSVLSLNNGILMPESGGLGFNPNNSAYNNKILMTTNGVVGFNTLSSTHIPSLDASKITTGALQVARGGTGVTSTKTIRTDLNSTTAVHALTGDIGVKGVLSAYNGGSAQHDSMKITLNPANGKSQGDNPQKVFTINTTSTYRTSLTSTTATATGKKLENCVIAKWGPLTSIIIHVSFTKPLYVPSHGNIGNVTLGQFSEFYTTDTNVKISLKPLIGAYLVSKGDNAGQAYAVLNTNGEVILSALRTNSSNYLIDAGTPVTLFGTYITPSSTRLTN